MKKLRKTIVSLIGDEKKCSEMSEALDEIEKMAEELKLSVVKQNY